MDRELKPPYVPPKEKLISDTEIKKMEQMNKKVYNEIEVLLGLRIKILNMINRKNKRQIQRNIRRSWHQIQTGIRTSKTKTYCEFFYYIFLNIWRIFL